jgi:hypothetical protein
MIEKMTVGCDNVFEDMGFSADEAAAMLARETLIIELEKELRKRGKKQQELVSCHQRNDSIVFPTVKR